MHDVIRPAAEFGAGCPKNNRCRSFAYAGLVLTEEQKLPGYSGGSSPLKDGTGDKVKLSGGSSMTNSKRWFLPLFLVFGSAACWGQATNAGDIRGSVTDPSGALVPDVTVRVVNVDTGVSKDLTTNQDGLYDTNSIVSGRYTVTFLK